MISKTKIKLRARNKTNPEVSETISLALKNKNWMHIAKLISSSTKQYSVVNLLYIDKNSSAGDTIIVPGKVLSKGNITKKIRICALSISKQAYEKLKESKSEFYTLSREISTNHKAEGIKILK